MIQQKKRCSYICMIFITEATIMTVFFIYFHWYRHSPVSNGENRPKVNNTAQDLYMNGELRFNVSLGEEECVEQFLQKYLEYCNRALVPPQDILRSDSDKELPLCPCIPHSTVLTEASNDIQTQLESRKTLDQTFSCSPVLSGGFWTPTGCLPRQRVAIIIPYRDRQSHLKIFLQIIHPFLQRQLLQYTVFIVEQVEPELFNRASLLNVGFKEATTRGQFDCFIFHDVDAIPEDDRNFYGCYKQPRHLAPYINKHHYKMRYDRMFGRANAFTRKQFERANGFSNEFYGWGGEDDDMLNRIEAVNMTFLRFPNCTAKYTVIEHFRDSGNPEGIRRFLGYDQRPDVYARNGLSSLVYKVEKYEKRLLYTWIAVSLPAPPDYLQRRKKIVTSYILKTNKIVPWNNLGTSSLGTS